MLPVEGTCFKHDMEYLNFKENILKHFLVVNLVHLDIIAFK